MRRKLACAPAPGGGGGRSPARSGHRRQIIPPAVAVVIAVALSVATNATAADTPCPDDALRSGAAAGLPDCRGFELVSPADKSGGTVFGGPDFFEPATAQATPSGSELVYQGSTAFPGTDSPSASLLASYKGARLGDGRWSTVGTSLPLFPAATIGASYQELASDDLTKLVVRTNGDPDTGQSSVRIDGNYYWRDLTTGARRLINKDPVSGSSAYSITLVGATPTLSTVLFESTAVLVPGATTGTKLYRYDAATDQLQLVSILPTGAPIAGRNGSQLGGPQSFPHVVSDDGSTVYYTRASGTAALYRRSPGTTATVNASENTNEVVALGVAQFRGASADGTRVFFTSTQRLLAADTNAVGDLYLWRRGETAEVQTLTVNATGGTFTLNVGGAVTAALPFDVSAADLQTALGGLGTVGAGNVSVRGGPGDGSGSTPYVVTFDGALTGLNVPQAVSDATALTGGTASATVQSTAPVNNLTLISVDTEPADGDGCGISATTATATGGVLGVSDDGQRVWFVCPGQLVAGEQSNAVPPLKLYYWDGSSGASQLRYVAALAAETVPSWSFNSSGLQYRKITPDGRRLLFLSSTAGLGTGDNGGLQQAYLVDATDPSGPLPVTCVSCPLSGPATAVSKLQEPPVRIGMTLTSRRNLSDDGNRVFFETDQPLEAGDTNGKRDVYQWSASGLDRISRGDQNSSFADASATGDDVFLFTSQPLVATDADAVVDIYDARVGGGTRPTADAPARCAGDLCQGSSAKSPDIPTLGSAAVEGPGDSDDPVDAPVQARITVRGFAKTVTGRSARLSLAVSGPGTLTVTGGSVRTAHRRTSRRATYRITVTLTRRAAVALSRRRTLRVPLKVVFRMSGGESSARSLTVTFRASGRRRSPPRRGVRAHRGGGH